MGTPASLFDPDRGPAAPDHGCRDQDRREGRRVLRADGVLHFVSGQEVGHQWWQPDGQDLRSEQREPCEWDHQHHEVAEALRLQDRPEEEARA